MNSYITVLYILNSKYLIDQNNVLFLDTNVLENILEDFSAVSLNKEINFWAKGKKNYITLLYDGKKSIILTKKV